MDGEPNRAGDTSVVCSVAKVFLFNLFKSIESYYMAVKWHTLNDQKVISIAAAEMKHWLEDKVHIMPMNFVTLS